MASIDEQFDRAKDRFVEIYKLATKQQQLRMYALFNQAVHGDVDPTPVPSSMQVVAHAKFKARLRLKGLPQEKAKKLYVMELWTLDPDWSRHEQATEEQAALQLQRQHSVEVAHGDGETGAAPRAPRSRTSSVIGKVNSNLQKRFANAGAIYRARPGDFYGTAKTLLCAYYNQATHGPCTKKKPLIGKAKQRRWRAWANLFDMPAKEAMEKYIGLVMRLAPEADTASLKQRTRSIPVAQVIRQSGNSEAKDKVSEAEEDEMAGLHEEGALGARLANAVGEGAVTDGAIVGELASLAKAAGGLLYFVTGATGFIGQFLIKELLRRNPHSLCFVLTRAASVSNLRRQTRKRYGSRKAKRLVPLIGDISLPDLGMAEGLVAALRDVALDHFFHLAAKYSLEAADEANQKANVDGTQYAVELANSLTSKFQYVSSVIVAGDTNGMFLESSFDEGQQFHNAYAQTKFEAERCVRATCTVPYRIYRPGAVVGSSETGEAFRIDGIYYIFKFLQRCRLWMPSSLILPILELGCPPIVPVDYVAKAMDHIAHKADGELDSQAFHLIDASCTNFVSILNTFAKAAHAPSFSERLPSLAMSMIPTAVKATDLPVFKDAPTFIAQSVLGVPLEALKFTDYRADVDDSDTRAALYGSDIRCPPLKSYAWRVWDFYERFLDPSLDHLQALRNQVKGKTVMITGASDGIGRRLAARLADKGAILVLVARSVDKLTALKHEVEAKGGVAHVYSADLSKEEPTSSMIHAVIADLGGVDILINNAGRSIRRSLAYEYLDSGRFHDFTRLIDLNYYGSLRCIVGFMSGMRSKKYGQIINISSLAVLVNQPRFGAYAASKAALGSFSRCVAGEVARDNISISTVYMPLIRTKMLGNNNYSHVGTYSTDEACELIERAVVTREAKVQTWVGWIVSLLYFFFPVIITSVLSVLYQLEPETAPQEQTEDEQAKGDRSQLKAITELFKGL